MDASGNVYVPDTWNHQVLKETLNGTGYTQTTIGSGWKEPWGITIDASGSLYVTDTGLNQAIKLTSSGSSYTQKTIDSGFNGPFGLAVDLSGNLYIADSGNNQVVKETLSSGVYTRSILITGLSNPGGVAVDPSGNLFIADTNNRRVLIETLLGGIYTQSQMNVPGLDMPFGVALDQHNNLYVVDTYHNKILMETLSSGSYTQTAIPTSAMYYPSGVAIDLNGSIYISDSDNGRVIKETLSGVNFGQVNVGSTSAPQTLSFIFDTADTLGPIVALSQGAKGLEFANAGTGTCVTGTKYTAGAICTVNATFTPTVSGTRLGSVVLQNATGIPIASAYIFGTGVGPQINFIPGTESTIASIGLNSPNGPAVDASGNLYFADYSNNRVVKETLTAGVYTQSTIGSGFNMPGGVAVDGAGNLYVSDTANDRVLVETLSGVTYTQSVLPTTGLSYPYGVAVDGNGNVYITDTTNNRILKETLLGGKYYQSSIGTGLLYPYGVAVDGSGNVYIADTLNNRVVKETLSAGVYTQSGVGGGFSLPYGIAVDGNGAIFIADTFNQRIAKETPTGISYYQTTAAGSTLVHPYGVAVDGSGNVYVADTGNNRLLKEDLADPPNRSFSPTSVGSTSAPQAESLVNIGNAPLIFPIPATGYNPSIAANFTLSGSGTSTCSILSVSSSAPATLAAEASCQLQINFVPSVAAVISGTLTITDNSLNAPAPSYATQSIPLKGSGTQGTPAITWATPAAITYGTALSALQLNATSTIAGTFAYSPAAGVVPSAGSQTLSVTFTPTDKLDYNTVTTFVVLVVNKVTPSMTWATPTAISYGIALSATQLNATSTVAGTFAYSPAAGTVPVTGSQTLLVTFTPTDATDYNASTTNVTLIVNKATPAMVWAAPSTITYGTSLGASQLSASSTVAGTFAYTPASGTVLSVGTRTLSVTFTPTDATDYTAATSSVSLVVNQATPAVTWAAPSAITWNTALSSTQLNATSTVPGAFVYSPAVGATLPTGTQTLSVTFTPTDKTNYATQTATALLTVNAAQQVITFSVPSSLTYGASAITLAATGGASGNPVTYTVSGPATLSGSVLTMTGAGTVTITASQAGSANYAAAKPVSQTITVAQAASTTALSAASLSPVKGSADLLTATVSGAGTISGVVQFTSSATTICTATIGTGGVATCSYAPATTGIVAIVANYTGDPNHTTSQAALTLTVASALNSAISLQASTLQLVYPGATNIIACIAPAKGITATGMVQIMDGTALLTTQTLQGNGCAYWYISPGLAAGTHSLTATYSGDKNNPGGTSTAAVLNVSPVPVNMSVSCWNASFAYGADYQCTVSASSNAGSALGAITYNFDGKGAIAVPLPNGSAQFTIAAPALGNHSVVIAYARQTNYAAAAAQTQTFTVTTAGVNVALTPSTYYAKKGTSVIFAATVTAWSGPAPSAAGSVSFYDNGALLGKVAISAAGQASFSTTSLSAATHNITATYAGSTNYTTASANTTITLIN